MSAEGGDNEVVPVKREVIEKKVLTCLEESGQVAILASKEDLQMFILAMDKLAAYDAWRVKAGRYANDMRQLFNAAFGR